MINHPLKSLDSPPDIPKKAAGFTLVELMITIAIAGVLASIALPSFRDFVRTQRVKSASFELVSALTLTRSEAIKRNTAVIFQARDGWQNGWTITVGEQVLRQQDTYNSVSITDSADASTVRFTGDGRTSTSTNFTVAASPASSSVSSRCISISLSGRPNSKIGGC